MFVNMKTNVRMCVFLMYARIHTHECMSHVCVCHGWVVCVFVYRIEIEIEIHAYKFKCVGTYLHVFACLHAQMVCLGCTQTNNLCKHKHKHAGKP